MDSRYLKNWEDILAAVNAQYTELTNVEQSIVDLYNRNVGGETIYKYYRLNVDDSAIGQLAPICPEFVRYTLKHEDNWYLGFPFDSIGLDQFYVQWG